MNLAKEMFLLMKGWEPLQAGDGMRLACVGCNNTDSPSGHKTTYLNMKVAPHWPMCSDHAMRASKPGWRQSSHYNGSSW